MKNLLDVLKEADEKKVAIGHFNISDTAGLKAIFEAARNLNLPILIGVSEGEREFIGTSQAAALVSSLRNEYNYPIFLNADHTHSLDKVKEAAIAGFDEILFDGSKLPIEENIRQTKEAVSIVKSINPNALVEGEIGYIGSSSEIVDEVPKESLILTTPEEAKRFSDETGIDVLAPAVGNMHGLLKSMLTGEVHKKLNIELITKIKEITNGKLMTLHGGSGTADEDFISAIKAGMTIVHVNTEIRVAWKKGVEQGLKQNPEEVAPYKILPVAVSEIEKVVSQRLKLFNSAS
jgi:fructose-bisphosphate aldolase class II